MTASRLVLGCVAAWAAAVAASFLHPYVTAPTGDGFVKGMNLIGIWIGWMIGALMFAVAALVVRLTRGAELSAPLRILATAPIAAMGMAAAAMAVLFATN